MAKKLSTVRAFISFLSLFIIIVLVDLFWTGVIAEGFYSRELGGLLASKYNLVPALFAWLVLAIGIRKFGVKSGAGESIISGGVLGFVVYGVYNLVNYAIVEGWSFKILVVDTLWGVVFCALMALAGSFLKNKVFKA